MSSSKRIDLKGTFPAGVYLSEAQNPIPPPPYTLYSVYLYTIYLITQWRGESLLREKYSVPRFNQKKGLEGQLFTKLGRKYQYDCP